MDKALIFIEKKVYKIGSHFGGQSPKGFEVFLRGHPGVPPKFGPVVMRGFVGVSGLFRCLEERRP